MEATHIELEALANLIAKQVESILAVKQMQSRWLTLEEAMHYAKVSSVNTIRKWIREGHIYAKKAGQWKIDRESIDAYFRSANIDKIT